MLCKPSVAATLTSMDHARAVVPKQEKNAVVGMALHEMRPVIGRSFGGKTIEKCEPITRFVLGTLGELEDRDRQELVRPRPPMFETEQTCFFTDLTI